MTADPKAQITADQKAQIPADQSAEIRVRGISGHLRIDRSAVIRAFRSAVICVQSSGNPRHGQAMVELAVFGSLLLLLLGVLVSYGANADNIQRVTMGSFRQALASAAESSADGKPSSISHFIVEDNVLADPSKPFAVGPMQPVTGSGSVVRNFRLQETADTEEELPRLALHTQGGECPKGSYFYAKGHVKPPCYFLLGGFRTEEIAPASLDRYKEIYGAANVCDKPECGGGERCVRPKEVINPETGEKTTECAETKKLVKIMDPCEGEIINAESCQEQARAIADVEICVQQCENGKTPGSTVNCRSLCQAPMSAPWYAGLGLEDPGSHKAGTHRWRFFNLIGAFLKSGPEGFESVSKLGLQPGSHKRTTMNNILAKHEDAAGITTVPIVTWRDDTRRTLVYRPYQGGAALPRTETVTATPKQDERKAGKPWTAPW